jgi:rhamnulokinase
MGMWLLERCRSAWAQDGKNYSYDEVVKMAKASPQFSCFIDPDHSSFLNPSNMPSAIVEFCRSTKQPVPQGEGEFVRCIFESLALK